MTTGWLVVDKWSQGPGIDLTILPPRTSIVVSYGPDQSYYKITAYLADSVVEDFVLLIKWLGFDSALLNTHTIEAQRSGTNLVVTGNTVMGYIPDST